MSAALAATMLTGIGAAVAQDASQTPPRHGPGMMADANHDGIVTREEVIADAERRFARVDTNGDGVITAEERQAAREAMRERMRERRSQRAENGDAPDRRRAGRRGHGERRGAQHERMMARVDANGDGQVTLAEARDAALARFAMVDTNQDGKIDQTERAAMRDRMMAMRHRQGPPPPPAGEMPPPPPPAD
ncbi:ca2+ sensor protein [Sphingosinithalassobacter portus]|uniref:ca2+ sensor protein n=1 Tax=Stakelama portus TaxID=2676234 RepID=UPI001EFE00D6|nr:ca2+ sensor protein [Sphingosinithalassobacter portus]